MHVFARHLVEVRRLERLRSAAAIRLRHQYESIGVPRQLYFDFNCWWTPQLQELTKKIRTEHGRVRVAWSTIRMRETYPELMAWARTARANP